VKHTTALKIVSKYNLLTKYSYISAYKSWNLTKTTTMTTMMMMMMVWWWWWWWWFTFSFI